MKREREREREIEKESSRNSSGCTKFLGAPRVCLYSFSHVRAGVFGLAPDGDRPLDTLYDKK
jgi:hypothetical protein